MKLYLNDFFSRIEKYSRKLDAESILYNKLIKQENKIVNILLFIIYVIALYPLTKIGFTAGDNIDLFVQCCDKHWQYVVGDLPYNNGRFYLIFTHWVCALPYLVDSPLYFYPLYILPIALCFIAFVHLIQKLFNNNTITIFSSLFLIASFQIVGFYSLTTSYPFNFTLSFAIIIFSLSLMLSYYDTRKRYKIILSSLLMFLATLFYETYLIYYLLFFIIAIWKRNLFNSFRKERVLLLLKDLYPFIIGGIIYLTAYFVFQHFYPPKYTGLQIADQLTFSGLIETMYTLCIYSFPLQVYKDFKYLISGTSLSGHNIIYLINSFLIAIISFYVLIKYKKIKSKNLLITLFIGIVFILLPQLFISLTKKYYLLGFKTYLPTFFSFFGTTITLTSLIFLIYNLLYRNKTVQIIFCMLLSFSVLYIAVKTQITNNAMADDLKLSSERFELVKKAIDKNVIPDIENQVICLEQAHGTSSKLATWVTFQGFTWKNYIFRVRGKDLDVYDRYNELYQDYYDEDKIVWVAFFTQSYKANQSIIYFAKIKGKDLPQKIEEINCDTLIAVSKDKPPTIIVAKELTKTIPKWTIKQNINSPEKEKRIHQQIEGIKTIPDWYNKIKQKAKENNISIKRQLRSDAQWIIEQQE